MKIFKIKGLVMFNVIMILFFNYNLFASNDGYPKNTKIDVINYVFNIGLSDKTDKITCKASVDVQFLVANVKELRLDLVNYSSELGYKGMIVTSVKVNDKELKLNLSRKCYICKQPYKDLHHFYHAMCAPCAKLNYEKRMNKADLTGKVALVTGGRTKIGFEIVVSLLQNGCTVYVTTRFPKNSLDRFKEADSYEEWKERLHVACVDFKITDSVYEFCEYFKTQVTHLDIIISNAAQTVRKKPVAYKNLVIEELKPTGE